MTKRRADFLRPTAARWCRSPYGAMINRVVSDLIDTTSASLNQAMPGDADAVRGRPRPLVGLSDPGSTNVTGNWPVSLTIGYIITRACNGSTRGEAP